MEWCKGMAEPMGMTSLFADQGVPFYHKFFRSGLSIKFHYIRKCRDLYYVIVNIKHSLYISSTQIVSTLPTNSMTSISCVISVVPSPDDIILVARHHLHHVEPCATQQGVPFG